MCNLLPSFHPQKSPKKWRLKSNSSTPGAAPSGGCSKPPSSSGSQDESAKSSQSGAGPPPTTARAQRRVEVNRMVWFGSGKSLNQVGFMLFQWMFMSLSLPLTSLLAAIRHPSASVTSARLAALLRRRRSSLASDWKALAHSENQPPRNCKGNHSLVSCSRYSCFAEISVEQGT